MGHDIAIGPHSLFLSFNWSVHSDIFSIHRIHGHDNSDGRVSKYIRAGLTCLAEKGVYPPTDVNTLCVDWWGHYKPGTAVDKHMTVKWGNGQTGTVLDRRGNKLLIEPKTKTWVEVARGYSSKIVLNVKDVVLVTDMSSFHVLCVFADILQFFLEIAEKYPNNVWFSDQVFSTSPLYGVPAKIFPED